MTIHVDVEAEMSRLRDFQRATADYAFARLFGDGKAATSRFLVADEVGLGKTMVARGVIAQTIDHLQRSGDERVDIVYICSNGAIAAQNLRKLAPAEVPVEHRTERLTLLAFRLSNRTFSPINLIALTPGTALAEGRSTGRFEERAAVLAALRQAWGGHRVRGSGILRIFAGGITSWNGYGSLEERVTRKRDDAGQLSDVALEHFRDQLRAADARRREKGLADLDSALHGLAPRFAQGRDPGPTARQDANELVGEFREALAMTGARLLQPDLVVLDEFQRFREVLHGESGYTSDVTKHLFAYHHTDHDRQTRVLMLSATPYVMHTTREEAAAASEDHYKDFLATYEFLASGLPGVDAAEQTEQLRTELAAMRTALADARDEGSGPVHAAAEAVGRRLREVMVRTERLASTSDRNGMLTTVRHDLPVPSTEALRQYAATAQVAQYVAATGSRLASTDVVEYWKAAPYTLSYLGAHEYQLAQRLRERVGPDAEPVDAALLQLLLDSPAVLSSDDIEDYEPLPPNHAGLEAIWRHYFDESEAHRLLWLPAAMPYYRAGGGFETETAQRLTKRLIFSAWTLVPTAIATLTTYEAERRLRVAAMAAGGTVYRYHDQNRFLQRIRFGSETQSMVNLQFVVPLAALADLGDPLTASATLRRQGGEVTLNAVLDWARHRITDAIQPYIDEVGYGRAAGSTSWYTLAPLLLDDDAERALDAVLTAAREESVKAGGESVTLRRHVEELARLRRVAAGEEDGELPPLPLDLVDVLARNAVAGPAVVMYRALRSVLPHAGLRSKLVAAATGADAFRSLINSPETYRIIDSEPGDGDFWSKVLDYCARGNLQAVMDEYLALLVENRGYDRAPDPDEALVELARDVRNVLAMRSVTYRPAAIETDEDGSNPRWGHVSMRGRFAMRYGTDASEDGTGVGDVGEAFNSPFWPFVLATTSVGQEGLDFHHYCHAVSHWNLPGNPVDLEQREGRVHRYKGHAVRKNVARVVASPADTRNPWKDAFAVAAGEAPESDMVPYWVFAPASLDGQPALIERHLPLTPYTRERSLIGPLLSSVTHYRLAFGQPRQDELLALLEGLDEGLRRELVDVRIALSPPRSRDRSGGSVPPVQAVEQLGDERARR